MVSNNFVHDAASTISGRGYSIRMWNTICDSRIENNIIYHCHTGVDIDTGGAGNVISYNFGSWFWLPHSGSGDRWMLGGLLAHGSHPYMNLFEGNYIDQIQIDNYWGSSSHNVLFRNHSLGVGIEWEPTMNLRACQIDYDNLYFTLIGNVMGKSGEGQLYDIPLPYTSDTNKVIYKHGWWCCGGPRDVNDPAQYDPLVNSTMLFHGNYDYYNNDVVWDPDISGRAIPASLYLDSKPSWFGDMPWPPIGPDVSGQINDIPAKVRWDTYKVSGDKSDLF